MFIHPVLLKQQFPKDAKVLIQALQLAMLDDDSQRDVRFLKSILSRMDKVHARMKRHIRRRKTLIASAEWDISPYDEAATDLANEAKRRLSNTIYNYFDHYISAEMTGESLVRLGWKGDAGSFRPFIERVYHPTELESNDKYLGGIAILNDVEYGKFTREEIAETERHHYIINRSKQDEPGGLLRSLLFTVFMLNMTTQEWTQFLTFVKGIIQGIAEKGSTEAEQKAAKEAVQSAVEHKFVLTTDKVRFEFHKLVSDMAGKSFNEFLQKAEEDIEIAITGASTLAIDRMRNASTVQERNEEDIAFWGRVDFAMIMNEQLLKADYFMNVNKTNLDADLPYYFGFKQKRTMDKEAAMRIIDMATDIGIPIPVTEFTRLTGVRLAEDGEETIKGQQDQIPLLRGD